MEEEGADLIDIGGESTRPNSEPLAVEEELRRVIPVIEALVPKIRIPLSIDTYKSNVAEEAIKAGARMINDISGGNLDDKMFETIADINLPYVMMHMQGRPQNMQDHPTYQNVTGDIFNDFEKRIHKFKKLNFNKIILDPGFGFGKTLEHNYKLLKELRYFQELGYPILAGVSRKGMINKVIGTSPVTSLNGTTVLNTIALLNGASIIRVHDVTEAVQAAQLVEFYKNVE
jgi:dihydropteroate synthase